MNFQKFNNGFIVSSKFKCLECWFNYWNPFHHVELRRSIAIYFQGEWSPKIEIFIAFLFFSIDLKWYTI